MRLYNIDGNLIQVIEKLYNQAAGAVNLNGSIGGWFKSTFGVRQGCLLSPNSFQHPSRENYE